MNAIKFRRPVCWQVHGFMITPMVLNGVTVRFQCPITHKIIFIRLKLEIRVPKTFDKATIRAAEEQAALEEHIWETEEESLREGKQEDETVS